MRRPTNALVLSSMLSLSIAKQTACPVRGQQYLPPDSLSTEPEFQSVTKSLDDTIDALSKNDTWAGLSFSVGVFSTSEEDLLWQYHQSSAGLRNSTQGGKTVDADSIYRIGSISKMLTMLLFLINDGERSYYDPISKYIPALNEYASQFPGLTPVWDDITLSDLAGQMAGLSRDYGLGDLAPSKNAEIPISAVTAKAFPNITESEVPTCGYVLPDGTLAFCTVDEYLQGVAVEAPIFSTAYTPVYSNEAFALLGLALENMTGLDFETIFNRDLVDALKLPGTFYTVPDTVTTHDIIPGGLKEVGWAGEFGVFAPAGGFFSSTNDFKEIGKAILSAKLLSPAVVNRWLKPTSFVEDYSQGVGRPWEIFRREINGASVEIYVKGGDWGVYHTFFALVPTYNLGFTVFTADDPGTDVDGLHGSPGGIPNIVLDPVLIAADNIARKQARERFGGLYSTSSSNSSLTISTDATETGLIVTQLISNGVDLLAWFESLQPNLVFRIMPNQLLSGDKVGFTGFYWSRAPAPDEGTWYWTCPTWVDVDELTYGNIPFGQMAFEVNEDGSATSVEVRSLRLTLKRQA